MCVFTLQSRMFVPLTRVKKRVHLCVYTEIEFVWHFYPYVLCLRRRVFTLLLTSVDMCVSSRAYAYI